MRTKRTLRALAQLVEPKLMELAVSGSIPECK